MPERSVLGRLRSLAGGRFDRGSVLSSAVIVVACGALLAAALAADGYHTPELKLHDAGVWLSRSQDDTGRSAPAVGRENTQIEEVDVKVDLAAAPRLLQSDATVLVHDDSRSLLCSIDGRSAVVEGTAALPDGARVALGGAGPDATAAVLDPATGDLWISPASSVLDVLPPATDTCGKTVAAPDNAAAAGAKAGETEDEEVAPATERIDDAAGLVVGTDGRAWVFVPTSGALRSFDATGAPRGDAEIELPRDHEFQLTVVGDTPVVLDTTDGVLRFPGGETELDEAEVGTSPVVQQPGPRRDRVVVATQRGLFEVPLGGGAIVPLTERGAVSGKSAAPLFLLGCSYGAWGGDSPSWAQRCVGQDETRTGSLPSRGPTGDLAIRSNRNRVVVNDLTDGSGYMLGEVEVTRALWNMATLEPDTDDESDESDSTDARDEEPLPPVAVDDTGASKDQEAFATRPGRAVVVHPMRNDYDPNGDVLVIRDNLEDLSGCECLGLVQGGLAVQVRPPLGWADDIKFRYTISDGTGQPDASAVALVEIRDEGENGPPTVEPQTTIVRSIGPDGLPGTVRHNVLAEARDPDGDAVGLVLPVDQPTAGSITAASDGLITYTAPGGTSDAPFEGEVVVDFSITDGIVSTPVPATLKITVIGPDRPNTPPAARGDHAVTTVGREVVVDVLANDSDPDGDPLRVTRADPSANAEISVDDRGRVRVTPRVTGPLVVSYAITDGFSGEVTGKIRVDVLDASSNHPPVAVRDDIVLPAAVAGSSETPVGIVDALANDFDVDGDVLVVEGVDVPEVAGLVVEVIDHRFLRARATRTLTAPQQFTYSVTDGTHHDSTTVVVRPGSVAGPQPPHARRDEFTVRAGAVATLDVLRNDTDPEGGRLEIYSGLLFPDGVFVQNGTLRYRAPSVPPPTPVELEYMAVDPDGRTSNTAVVRITVLKPTEPNRAPEAMDLTARTLAGREVVIPIPVATMDPDGDDVTLLGLAEGPDGAPQHGAIVAIGTDRLTYRPDVWTGGFWGTDVFRYRVRDAQGAVATATIRVGVAAPPSVNHPPVAIDDLRHSNNKGITIDVVRNDSDPDGDKLALVAESLRKTEAGAAWRVEAVDGRVRFDPRGLGDGERATFTYDVTDGVLVATGRVSIVMSNDLPSLPPIALDDRGPATEAGEPVTIDVLQNDIDPDGDRADLRVTAVEVIAGLASADAPSAANPVRFTMPAADVVLRYEVTDAAGLPAHALVRVRLASADTPYPPTAVFDEARTTEGKPVSVKVLANDSATPGRTLQLLDVVSRPNGTCERAGDEVVYTPTAGFSGWGGCSYVIGDGPGDSPSTLKAVGTLAVEVEANGNTPPRFVPQRLTIYADKETRTFSLRAAVVDVDDLTQRGVVCLGQPEGETEGITATIEGSDLRLTAASGTPEGETPLTFTVSDCTDEAAEPGLVTVIVSRYTGPLAQLANDPIETTQQVPTAKHNVIANDTPSGLDDPLTLVRIDGTEVGSAPIPVANGSVTAERAGSVVFTPDPKFHGVTTFTYTADDGTKDPARFQTATVIVTVVGFPEPPPLPSVGRGSRQLSLSWGVPADNGAPILRYLIEVQPGGRVIDTGAPVSSRVVTDLANGTEYSFRVAALNKANNTSRENVQWSDPTPLFSPNVNPNQPASPTARFDPAGKAIDVSWSDPGSDGTRVEDYELVVSPAPSGLPGGRVPERITATSYKVTGLTNGTEYTFTVQAFAYNRDSGGEERLGSLVSPPSAPEIPAAPPDAPAKPTINPSDLGDNNITVHWNAPAANGDAIATYHVEYFTGGASQGVLEVPGGTLSTTVYNTDNNKKYTFTVTAENKAGKGNASVPSDPVNSSGAPEAPAKPGATEGDTSSTLTFAQPADNGAAIDGYAYRQIAPSVGGWVSASDVDGGPGVALVAGGLANGTTYRFEVRVRNTSPTGQERWSPASPASDPVRPFGPPTPPVGLSGSQNSNTLTWTWGAGGLNGHDSFLENQVSLNGGGFGSVGGAYSYQVNVSPGECRTLAVRHIGNRTVSPNRQTGQATGGVQACAPPPPTPIVEARLGTISGGAACDFPNTSRCRNMEFRIQNFPPGAAFTAQCQVVNTSGVWQTVATYNGTANGSGAWGWGSPNGCYVEARRARVVVNGIASNEVGTY